MNSKILKMAIWIGCSFSTAVLAAPKVAVQRGRPVGTIHLALQEASARGDLNAVKVCLFQGANVDFKNRNGRTALMAAAGSKAPQAVEILRVLLRHGAKIEVRDGQYETALFYAVRAKSLQATSLLLQKGAATNAFNSGSQTVLNVAVIDGTTGLVELLLKRGAQVVPDDNFGSSLQVAAEYGRTEALQLMKKYYPSFDSDEGGMALVEAASSNQAGAIRVLVQFGAPINYLGRTSSTPLTEACEKGNLEAVKVLLELGAKPNLEDAGGDTPLTLASTGAGDDPVGLVKLLLAKGAKVNGSGKAGSNSPIGAAAAGGELEIVQLLLAAGANPNGRTQEVFSSDSAEPISALRALFREGNGYLLEKALLAHGEKLTAAERESTWKEHLSADAGIVKALLDKGVRVDAGENQFVILDAAEDGNLEAVRLLIEHGSSVNQLQKGEEFSEETKEEIAEAYGYNRKKTPVTADDFRWKISEKMLGSYGRNPLLAASGSGSVDVVQYLLEHGASADYKDLNDRTALFALADGGRHIQARSVRYQSELSLRKDSPYAFQRQVSAEEQAWWDKWAETGDSALTELLIKSGTEVDAQDLAGDTALTRAATQGNFAVVKGLLMAGANPNLQDKSGETVLMRVLRAGQRSKGGKFDSYFLKERAENPDMFFYPAKGPKVDAAKAEFERNTARVVRENVAQDVKMLRLLLESGADAKIKDKRGMTALDLARALKYPEAAQILGSTESF